MEKVNKEGIVSITDGILTQLTDNDIDYDITLDGDVVRIEISIEGEEMGYMIGNKGYHLKGTQYVLSQLINKKFEDDDMRYIVNLDVGGYKRSLNEKLEQEALAKADDVRILGDSLDMEPMNAAQRRIVHLALEKFDDIRTESFGEGRDRCVRIIPIAAVEADLGILEDDTEGLDNKVVSEEVEDSEE